LLATTPADTISRDHADQAAAILLRVYEQNPDHPGAMHYLVHANDVPGREHELLEITQKYESIAPNNPHALHMPTHIYTRLGDWPAVIRGNLKAAEAALQTPAGEHGELVWDEFPHAIEYLVYAYLQQGADDAAATQIKRLRETPQLEPTFKTAFHSDSTRARYALERHNWDEAVALVPREPATLDWNRFAWAEAIGWFARGLGAAHLRRTDEAKAAIQRLEQLEAAMRTANEELFARNIHVLRLEVSSWLAHSSGETDASLAQMREAAELESSTPKHAVTPAPTLPAYELLGDLFMDQKQPADALAAYRRSLELYPRRYNTLLGAARAALVLDEEKTARDYYQQLLDVASPTTTRSSINEAKEHLGQRESVRDRLGLLK
jgi:tetratricopeptide (TPR) repeat protein